MLKYETDPQTFSHAVHIYSLNWQFVSNLPLVLQLSDANLSKAWSLAQF